ncbi:5-formyltetrahydrofolate cyclo-ligase [Chryseobacterium sp. T16E-39]|uniref:5-formyltetrahydrofolate cyclo-ligase n=1 Tax=Chryseobacterium sp. T16E-39 TaxID=2015076 RepID=UPI000B5B2FAC|nr:5-formyltetrahydrofolate cyclo-ligase [Chryseobacterium sp. T16E-39]ASK31609.1 5-formyltetrahydrofolate cyclo-ligase [Chryseobacterium sp. T16E-39]
MLKAELRKKYMQKRKTLSHDEVFFLSERIFEKFVDFFNPLRNQKVHIFLPIEKFMEIDTQIFVKYFLSHHIRVFVPKVVGQQLISVEIFSDTEFEINSWGILEPLSNKDSGELGFDFVVTPVLYCDHNGNRLGYGKGFYDGFFQNLPEGSKKIGVNYFSPDETIDDIWENDIPLDYLVTPTEVLSFFAGEE